MKVTAEDIAQLLASAPPRQVPAHVAKAAQGSGCAAWFLPLFGLFFGGFGLLFVVLFFPWNFMDEWRLAADGAREVPGVITGVTKANLSINDTPVMGYDFRYTPEDGRLRRGRCYTTGDSWTNNQAVTVRYLPAKPDLACVVGARLSKGGGSGVFTIIFPLIGSALVVWFVVTRCRTRRLLHEGVLAEVDVLSVDETTMKVNYETVYRIVVAAPGLNGGQPVTVKRVKKADVNLALKHARDKQPVFVLHDPRHPARLIFPEALIDAGP